MQGNMAGEVAEAGPISEEQIAFPGSISTDGDQWRLNASSFSIQSSELCMFVHSFPISIEEWGINQV